MVLRIYARHLWRIIFGGYVALRAKLVSVPSGVTLHIDLSARQLTFTFFADKTISVHVKGTSHYRSAMGRSVTKRYECNHTDGELSKKIKTIALRARKTCELGLPVLLNQHDLDVLYDNF